MAQKLVRLIYSASTCQLRRTIVTDEPNGLHGHNAGPGEAELDIPFAVYQKFSIPVSGLPHLYALGAYIAEKTGGTYHWTLLVDKDDVVQYALHIDEACGDTVAPHMRHLDHRKHPFHPHMPGGRVVGHIHRSGHLIDPTGALLK